MDVVLEFGNMPQTASGARRLLRTRRAAKEPGAACQCGGPAALT